MSTPEKMYDVFAGSLAKDPQWILAVTGQSMAVKLMNRLAIEYPGAYFVFDTAGRSVVAQIDSKTCFAA
ncbi:MAG TPA: hypothetical protein VMD76_07080 [Candidatus Sulfotelmatobacter sp.]|nr:hypothetical protein [Candidatus Sulfotelmatobacter sp.]